MTDEWMTKDQYIEKLEAERDRYREALEQIKAQPQDCLRNTCQTIATKALAQPTEDA